jgi:hypothetical protein
MVANNDESRCAAACCTAGSTTTVQLVEEQLNVFSCAAGSNTIGSLFYIVASCTDGSLTAFHLAV